LGEELAKSGGAKSEERGARSRKSVQKRALVIALQGDLGAGKTTFVQGFLKGLGIKKRATSPTFIIMRRYKIPRTLAVRRSHLHHMDAYRLRKPEDVSSLGFKEILADRQNIILIEWPENIKGALPRRTRRIQFKYGKKENERIIKI
jgi:tRNA threonylcarbamoyladenosine biosynthesis protein TsaE